MGCGNSKDTAGASPASSPSAASSAAPAAKKGNDGTFASFLASKPEEINLTEWMESNKVTSYTLTDEDLEALSKCTNCKKLGLQNQKLSVTPDCVKEMSDLEELDLSENELKALDDILLSCANLTSLQLFKNEIAEIPDDVAKLQKLEDLNMFNNKIKKVSPSLNECVTLTSLNLGDNNFMKFPPIEKLVNLTNLQLQWGKVIKIEGSWETLTSLETIMLNQCRINALPAFPTDAPFTSIDVSKNLLTELPAAISTYTKLEELICGNNDGITNIPEDFFPEGSSIQKVDFAKCKIVSLPASVSNLKNLRALFIGDNKIETLPGSLDTLAEILAVNVKGNPLNLDDEDTKRVYEYFQGKCEGARFQGI